MYELLKYRDRALRENAECAAQAVQPAHLRRRRARTAAQLTAQPDRKTDHLLDDHCRAPEVVVNASGYCEGLDHNASYSDLSIGKPRVRCCFGGYAEGEARRPKFRQERSWPPSPPFPQNHNHAPLPPRPEPPRGPRAPREGE